MMENINERQLIETKDVAGVLDDAIFLTNVEGDPTISKPLNVENKEITDRNVDEIRMGKDERTVELKEKMKGNERRLSELKSEFGEFRKRFDAKKPFGDQLKSVPTRIKIAAGGLCASIIGLFRAGNGSICDMLKSPITTFPWLTVACVAAYELATGAAEAFDKAEDARAITSVLKNFLSNIEETQNIQAQLISVAQENSEYLGEEIETLYTGLLSENKKLLAWVDDKEAVLKQFGGIVKNFASDLSARISKNQEKLQSAATSMQESIESMGNSKDILSKKVRKLWKDLDGTSKNVDELVNAQREVLENGLKTFEKTKDENITEATKILLEAVKKALDLNAEIEEKNRNLRNKFAEGLSNLGKDVCESIESLNAQMSAVDEEIKKELTTLEGLKEQSRGFWRNLEVLTGNGNSKNEIDSHEKKLNELTELFGEITEHRRQLGLALEGIQSTNSTMQDGIKQAQSANEELGNVLKNSAISGRDSYGKAAALGAGLISLFSGVGPIVALNIGVGTYLCSHIPDSVVNVIGKMVESTFSALAAVAGKE